MGRQLVISYRAFSFTWPAAMLIYWNKRKRLHWEKHSTPRGFCWYPTWPPFHCFGTPIWPPWRHVKTLYSNARLKWFRACLHGGRGPRVGEVTHLGGVTCLSIYILIWSCVHDRWGHPPHVTSPIWGPPPLCKQALRHFFLYLIKYRWLPLISSLPANKIIYPPPPSSRCIEINSIYYGFLKVS